MAEAIQRRLISVEEYLALEEASEIRHEYVEGELYAFAGASWWHGRIVGNIARRLLNSASDGPCSVFIADMMFRVAERIFYYPDVVVACDPDEVGSRWVERPCLLVEVLSPSTEATDRREKLLAYQATPSVRSYLIVSTDNRYVIHYRRDAEGRWKRDDVIGDGELALPCPETILTLEEIYRGVTLPDT